MTDTPVDLNQTTLNLQSACQELEQQNKWLSNRCAAMAVERDNALRRVEQVTERLKQMAVENKTLSDNQKPAELEDAA